jgi:hypothetical protein
MLPQVTFRGLMPSTEIMDVVCRKTRKLSEIAPLLRGCHVVIEASPRGSQRPISYRVSLQLSNATEAGRRNAHANDANLHTALRDVFRAARRQLEQRERHARAGALLEQLTPHGDVHAALRD